MHRTLTRVRIFCLLVQVFFLGAAYLLYSSNKSLCFRATPRKSLCRSDPRSLSSNTRDSFWTRLAGASITQLCENKFKMLQSLNKATVDEDHHVKTERVWFERMWTFHHQQHSSLFDFKLYKLFLLWTRRRVNKVQVWIEVRAIWEQCETVVCFVLGVLELYFYEMSLLIWETCGVCSFNEWTCCHYSGAPNWAPRNDFKLIVATFH